MLSEDEIRLIRDSYAAAQGAGGSAVRTFYDALFERDPSLKLMFHEDITDQAEKLEATLQVALNALVAPETLVRPLESLGATHEGLGVTAYHYQLVAEVLIDTLAEGAGDAWSPEASLAWSKLLTFVAQTMMGGAKGEPSEAA